MAKDLNIRDFFRRSPAGWLRRHFEQNGALSDFDWSTIKPRNVQPLMDAWSALGEDIQARMQVDFAQITLLATRTGKVQILDEADYQHKRREVAAQLETLNGFYECAYCAFFEHPNCWQGAVRFAQSDSKSRRSWRKRANMPRAGRAPTAADGRVLAAAIIELFRHKEARGQHCVVEQYRRLNREYYFAYSQDHRQTSLEFAAGRMTNRPHRPAFEIIFIHDNDQRTLSIWHEGHKERVQDLQVAFARAVLGQEIAPESPRDDRVYDLDGLLDSDFQLQLNPALGIARAEVREMRVEVLGSQPCTLSVVLGAKATPGTLRQQVAAIVANNPPSMLRVRRVRIRAEFDQAPDHDDPLKPCTFDLSTPNSCNLPDDERGILVQRLLEENGIEPRQPVSEPPNGRPAG
jgi:hypothetical protein